MLCDELGVTASYSFTRENSDEWTTLGDRAFNYKPQRCYMFKFSFQLRRQMIHARSTHREERVPGERMRPFAKLTTDTREHVHPQTS
jgi:hypothetical protein